MKVLVVGSGGVGSAFAMIARRRDFFEQVVLADLDETRARTAAENTGDPRFIGTALDASDRAVVADCARSHGATHVLNAADPRFVMPIFGGAFDAGATYLDMAMSLSKAHPERPHEEPGVKLGVKLGDQQFAEAAAWEERGLLALVGVGVEPGLSDVFARYAADELFSAIDECGVPDGADLVVDGYAFAPTFSIWTTIEECLNPPVIWEKDRGWFTTPRFSEPETFVFPEGIGPVECVNVEHEEVLLIPRWIDCQRVTFKYGLGDEFIEVLQVLNKVGLDRTATVKVRGMDISPRDVVAACLPDPAGLGDRMRGRTCASTWVTGTGKDGNPREVYLYHLADNEKTMRRDGSQAVVWQTAINPVVALELLATGAWTGIGVLGPDARSVDAGGRMAGVSVHRTGWMVGSAGLAGTVLGRQQSLAGRVELWLETATQEQRTHRCTRHEIGYRPIHPIECVRVPAPSMQETPPMPPTFADLGVPARLCERLEFLGITEPFPVQSATLPDALAGRDVCGKAPTGSGKTIAFGLPLLARVEKAAPRRPKALVLVPTRELASQVQDQLMALCWGTKTEVLAVYGGAGMDRQMRALAKGVEVVVATPGRLKDLLERGSLRLDDVSIVVIDEADRMADMGFLPEVRRLLDMTNKTRQTMLFSATLDGDVDVLIRNYQTNPAHHEAASLEVQGEVTHRFWAVSHADRIQVATAVVERCWPAIVFSRTRHGAERLSKQLNKAGVRSEAIHGDRSQSQREKALRAFGKGDVHVLVATDVAARGIHVDGVACVLQYDPPATDKDYVHRSGRTGRAGEAGTVITLVSPEKEKDVRKMQRELRRREPIEAATVATAATILASAPPKPVDRGDELDGVSRRERARAEDRPRPERSSRPARPGSPKPARGKGHRKGESPRVVSEGDWTPRPKPAAAGQGKPAASHGRNGQERAGTPARSGRPGAKPGRRPAGAGAARPGRPASGNARRRSS